MITFIAVILGGGLRSDVTAGLQMKIQSQILLLRKLRNLSKMVSSLLLSAQMQLKCRDDEKIHIFRATAAGRV